jgi:hypothetical protein
MIAKPLKRLARWIWTAQVALEYSAQLAHHGWTWQQCKDLAEQTAENCAEDCNADGWLIGRRRITPSEAVFEELSCWTD